MNQDEELSRLLDALHVRGLDDLAAKVEPAFRRAAAAHEGQERSDGRPYLVHPLGVARILLEEWGARDGDVLAAALLHDAVEDTPLTLAEVEAGLGKRVRDLVDLLTKPKVAGGAADAAADASDDGGARAAAKAARDAAYFERLATSPDACLVKAADRVDNLRDVLTARWSEEKKRAYAQEALDAVLPAVRRGCPDWAGVLEATARETLERLARGEGDIPDVGPNEDVAGVAPVEEDPVLVRSKHLSFFRKGPDCFLYHDLIGDIIQLHEKVIPFLDFFAGPRRSSEARAQFKGEFLDGDMDAFFETFRQHLCLLGEGEDDEVVCADWYPIHGPWTLSHRHGGQTTAQVTVCYKDRDSTDAVAERLSPPLSKLYLLCDGARTAREVAAEVARAFPSETDASVLRTVRQWTHSRRQVLKLLSRPLATYELVGLPPYSQSTMPYERLREGGGAPPDATSTREYHKLEIRDANEQFDLRETTLSHAFRAPHPALEGRSYGVQLARILLERDVLQDDGTRSPLTYVEVGGGTGYFARALLDGLALHAPRLYNRMRYHLLDIAPALRASQRERAGAHGHKLRLVAGDAQDLPFRDASVDFLVANEMIADLEIAKVWREELGIPESTNPGVLAVRRHGLPVDDAPGLFVVNVGAIELVEECARVLRPGGTAFVSEFGSHTRYPEQSTHLDHAEFSIHFGHLKVAAERLGLETSLEQLAPFLRLDGTVKVLHTTQAFFETLRAYLATFGITVDKLAYTEDMFRDLLGGKVDPAALDGLKFGPCGTRVLGLKPREFKVLVIRKPREQGRVVKKVELDF